MKPNPPDYDPDAMIATIDPVPVRIIGVDSERAAKVEQGVWMNYIFAATDQPQQILPQNSKRKQAVITVQPGNAASIVGFLYIGDQARVFNRVSGRGYNGNSITVESAAAVWAAPDGTNSLSLTVLDESYL